MATIQKKCPVCKKHIFFDDKDKSVLCTCGITHEIKTRLSKYELVPQIDENAPNTTVVEKTSGMWCKCIRLSKSA